MFESRVSAGATEKLPGWENLTQRRLGGPILELFSSKVSVDQDLSVIVAETINDDDVKQRLVPIVFTRA